MNSHKRHPILDIDDSTSSCGTDEDSDNSRICMNGFQLVHPVKKTSFEKFLECPICLDICIPPVFVCTTGHHMCEKCKEVVKECSICTSKFTGGRNFFYEECVENSTFKCKYLSEGCQEILLGKEIKSHLQNCDYRPIDCFRCEGKGIPYTKFLKHYADSHKGDIDITLGKGGEFRCRYRQDFRQPGTWWLRRVVEFDGHTFFPVARQSGIINPRVGLFLWIFGNEKEARKYNVKISLETDTGNTAAAKRPRYWSGWEGPVVSIRMDLQQVLEVGKRFLTSPAVIQTAGTYGEQPDLYWTPTFKITRVPVSIVDEGQGRATLTRIKDEPK